jgi:hypothetical protein
LRQDLCQELKLETLQTAARGSPAEGDGSFPLEEVTMPKALVSMAVMRIAPGTIGVRVNDDDLPVSGFPGRCAGYPGAALTAAKAQTSFQFLRAIKRSETSCAGISDVGNAQQGSPAKSE